MLQKIKKVERSMWEYVASLIMMYIIGAHHIDTVAYLNSTSEEVKWWIDWAGHSPLMLIIAPIVLKRIMTKKSKKL